MKFQRFEDIQAWQLAEELTLACYKELSTCKDFSFRDQIQRATVSIMNNIAEGYERSTNKEFIQFLYIAKGSCGEARSMLGLGLKLGYFKQDFYSERYNQALRISKMLSSLIKTLRTYPRT